MDFDRIKRNLRLRSGRTPVNLSKRFPTAEPVRVQPATFTPRAPRETEKIERPHNPGAVSASHPNGQIQKKPKKREDKTPKSQAKNAVSPDVEKQKHVEIGNQKIREHQHESKSKSEPVPMIASVERITPRRSSKDIDQLISPPVPADRSKDVMANQKNPCTETEVPAMEISIRTKDEIEKTELDQRPDCGPSESEEIPDFDLRAPRPARPKPSMSTPSVEMLLDLLLGEGYLNTITGDTSLLAMFTTFLNKYKPSASHLVHQYIEAQKVTKAVRYANAIATGLMRNDAGDDSIPDKRSNEDAVALSPVFLEYSQEAFRALLDDCLPAWVTYSLIKAATTCLTVEITNQHSSPLTRDLVGGLSEVFCITDPSQEDNPIVYASEEFFRLTGYSSDTVIGRNCRFLQGPKTKPESVRRLREAIAAGEEINETVLNYRRDGRPFVNVLMLAPLHDDKGNVKYYLGAQVDASRLVEGGRGIDGFEQYILKRELEAERRGSNGDTNQKELALARLRDLSMAFDLEESAVVQASSRSGSRSRPDETDSPKSMERLRRERRVLRDDEDGSETDDDGIGKEDSTWTFPHTKPSGGLPGIYRKYFLIRPFPSLRVVFVSRAMGILGQLQQHPFLAHVAAPRSTLSGLKESFESGTPVTAKVAIKAERENVGGTETGRDLASHGRLCWISATPLLDSENKIGVWMVIVIDKIAVPSKLGSITDQHPPTRKQNLNPEGTKESHAQKSLGNAFELTSSDIPIRPKRVGSPGPMIRNEHPDAEKVNYDQLNNHVEPAIQGDPARYNHDQESEKAPTEDSHKPDMDHLRDVDDEVFNDTNNAEMESVNGFSEPTTPPNRVIEDADHILARKAAINHTNHETNSDGTARPGSSHRIDMHPGRPASGILSRDYICTHSPGQSMHFVGVEDSMSDEDNLPNGYTSPYSVD